MVILFPYRIKFHSVARFARNQVLDYRINAKIVMSHLLYICDSTIQRIIDLIPLSLNQLCN